MQIGWTHLYERLLFLECFAFGGVPDFSDIAGLFDLKPRALGLSRLLVCGLGFSPAQPRALAVRVVLSLLVLLLWRFLSGMGCGFWPGSKVNAEMISFLRARMLCLYLCSLSVVSKRAYKFLSNAVDTGSGFD